MSSPPTAIDQVASDKEIADHRVNALAGKMLRSPIRRSRSAPVFKAQQTEQRNQKRERPDQVCAHCGCHTKRYEFTT